MTEIPDAAVQAATRAIGINIQLRKMPSDMARAVLEAAAPFIAEQARADERRKMAEQIRAIPDDDGPFHTGVRKFIDRHARLVDGTSIVAALLAVADEIEGAVSAAPARSGTLHPPQGPVSDSAPPATPGHADAPPNASSTRTSPHMSDTNHTRHPRNEEA